MDSQSAFFTMDECERYVPTRYSRSAWSDAWLNGPSIVAAQARSLEAEHSEEGFQPARLTVDLFAPVRFVPFSVITEQVRSSGRIRVADSVVMQEGQVLARATLVQLRRGEQPPGSVWSSDRDSVRFPRAAADESLAQNSHHFFVGTPDDPQSWSRDMAAHQNGLRKSVWNHPRDVVQGECATPFQRTATLAEATSLVTNWGSEGIGFINADLTVTLARLPRSDDIGIVADEHFSDSGISVGTATMVDRDGAFGTGTVVAVSNAGRQIDFSRR